MEYGFIGFYLVVFILAGVISYAGTENTLNLVRYVDLSIRYQIVLVRTFFMRRKLKRVLNKSMKELQNDRKNSI